jgi:hypothetical protein
MKKPNPFVTLLLAIVTLGIYPMRKAAKAKKDGNATTTSPMPGPDPVIPTPSAHIDTIADSMPPSPQPMTPPTPPTPPAPVVEIPAVPEEPAVTLPPTPPVAPTPTV